MKSLIAVDRIAASLCKRHGPHDNAWNYDILANISVWGCRSLVKIYVRQLININF